MSKKIKFAVIGCGRIGYRHCTIIKNTPKAKLVAIVDIDKAKHSKIKTEFEIPVFENLLQLKEQKIKIDVLCVCTPNGVHIDHCESGLLNGYHILCEKPFGLKAANCEFIIKLSKNIGKKVFCVMQNRYSPPSEFLKDTILLLDDIYLLQVNCFWNRNEDYYKNSKWKGTLELDGGPLYTQFSHFIDTLFYTFGNLKVTSASFAKHTLQKITEFEDTGTINFKIKNGGNGTFNYSTAVHQKNLESSITIIGEKGTIKIGGQYMDEVLHCNIEDYKMKPLPPTNPPNNYGNYKGSAANHSYVYKDLISELNGDYRPITSAEEGMKVVEFIEAAYEFRDLSKFSNKFSTKN